MKVYPEKLASHLKNTDSPIYIVSGDEPLLVQEACDQIRSGLKDAGYTERELFHAEANFDWQQVLFSASSMSLFAEQKLIEIRMSSIRPGDKGAALQAYVENPAPGTIILLVMPRLEKKVSATKWFKAIEQAGALVQIWPIELKDLPGWINTRFGKAGLKASREAVAIMAERIEGNLLAAVQEIERLKLLSSDGTIDVADVVEGVANSSRYDVFTLLDAAVAGDTRRTLKIVQGLKLEGVDVLYILAMLSRELRSLASMAGELKATSLDAALKKGRVWAKRREPVSRCLCDHPAREFQELLSRLSDIDQMVKGILNGNPWDELTSVVMALAGAAVTPRQIG
ncbi:MAG: DNA polymerase III subunit delta [Gammaproteobacteria bacterium]|nr:DNA polymerase III subunit delta [Gammaproteobacteria bacterium]